MRVAEGMACLALALTGCARDEAPPQRVQAPPSLTAAPAASTRDVAPEDPAEADEPGKVEVAQEQRLSAARDYLDQARLAAAERHRRAMRVCDAQVPADRDGCTEAADEALESDEQAARAEFESHMRQPN